MDDKRDELLTARDAARILGLSRDMVGVLAKKGVLPFRRTSGGYRVFRRQDVERLAARRSHPAEAKEGPKPSKGYRGRREISRGERFDVFRARRADDGRPVVLKVVAEGGEQSRSEELLRHEHDMLRRVAGHGVARALAVETLDGRLALVLEDAGPHNLAELDRGRPFETERFLEFAIAMAEILGAIHDHGVIHRDICPANFVVGERLVLVDFEVATAVPAFAQAPGLPGELEGTLAYLAPEQTGRTKRSVDYRADLYALGATFYEMLTGAPPFRLAEPIELVHAQVARPPHAPTLINPAVPTQLSNIVLKLLSKMPEWRYQSAASLRADLEEARRQWTARGRIDPFELGRDDVPYGFFRRSRLYGRDADLGLLREAVGRVARGSAEVFLVTGPTGIGKSALVEALRDADEGPCRWLSGKSDQLRGNVPYAPIIEAFQPLIRELLREPPEVSAAARGRIQEAIGSNGRVLSETLPDLERLLGPQPPVADVGPVEAENRFHHNFCAFVRAIASAGPPLVLFLDDLQWADPASLKLLRSIVTLPDLRSFLLLGAFRSEEVDAAHPLARIIEGIREAGTRLERIELAPLDLQAVLALLCDGLAVSPSEAEPFAAIVHRKTAGAPFFVHRFLGFLYRSGALAHSAQRRRWTWDLRAAEAAAVTENAVDLLAPVVDALPAQAREALAAAACIGNRFSLSLLASIVGEPMDELARRLWLPVHEELIVSVAEDGPLPWAAPNPVELRTAKAPTYRFSHDRIQQAFYRLLGEEERKRLHLRIGERLLAMVPPTTLDGVICLIVDQLDRALELIPAADRLRVAELNERAGAQARAQAAYGSAAEYFRAGMALLPPDAWRTEQRDLAFRLLRGAAECSAFSGEYGRCEQLVDEGLARAEGLLFEQARLYGIIIRANATRGAHHEALRRGREAARLLGIELPATLSSDALRAASRRARQALATRSDPQLLELRPVEDPVERARMDLLADLVPPAWFSDLEFFQLLTSRAIEMTVTLGLTPASPAVFAYFGISLAMEEDYEEARRYGLLGVQLAERSHDAVQESRTLLVLGGHLSGWRAPARESLPLFRRSYARGVESGELQFAAYALANALFTLLFCGGDLDEIIAQAGSAVAFYRRLGHSGGLPYVLPIRQAARCLKGLTRARASFDDESFDEASFLRRAADNGLGLAVFFLARLQVSQLLGEIAAAGEYARKARQWLPEMRTIFFQADFFLYDSLVLADAFATAPAAERPGLMAEVRDNLQRLEAWARSGPANFAHKRQLIAAELAVMEGRPDAALALYHEAIELACASGFVQDEATAQERCARLAAALGHHRIAELHLKAALEGYERWGAAAKVQRLLDEFPKVARSWRRVAATPRTAVSGPVALDHVSLLAAAETLSSELVLDRLLEKLLRVCLEAVSAQRAILALEERGLVVRATANAAGEVTLAATPLVEGSLEAPARVLAEVFHSREIVVLGDASRSDRFKGDPYLAAQQVRSLLAVPICRAGRRLGVLYFENNLSTDAFSEDRVEILRLLSGEIAVALENSLLFEERRRAESALRLLADASAALSESLDLEACLAKLGALVVPAIADWCLVDVLEDGHLRPVVSLHVNPEKAPVVRALHRDHPVDLDSPHPRAEVLRTGKPLLAAEISEDLIRAVVRDEEHLRLVKTLEPRSLITVPLIARGRKLGSAAFGRSWPRAPYEARDLELVEELARRVSLALDNALLHGALKEAMRQRVERDRYLSMTFRQLPGAVWTTDRELRITYVTGRPVEGPRLAVGSPLAKLLDARDPTDVAIAYHRAALAGERQSFQYKWQDRWYAVLVEPFRNEQGEIAGCVGLAFDVTERRAMEERLAFSEARLREAQRVAHIGSFEWDIAANVVTWSDELHRIYGLKPGEFGGTYEAFLACVPPEEREYTKGVIFDAYTHVKPFVYDHHIRRADGSLRTLHTRGDVVADAAGRPIRLVGACWDVTDLKESIRKLEYAVSRWEATLNATAEGILAVDREGRITACNERYLSLWRIPREHAHQRHHEKLLAPVLDQLEEPDAFVRRLHELAAHREQESFDLIRFKDGRVFERYSIPQHVGEEVVGRVWSIRDITERERLFRRAQFLADTTRLLASLDVEPALDSVAHMAVPFIGDGCAIDLLGNGGPRRLLVISRDTARPFTPEIHGTVLAGHPTIYSAGGRCYMAVPLLIKALVVGAMTFVAAPGRRYTPQDLELAEELARRAALSVENARLYRGAQEALEARDEFLSIAAHEIRGPITSMHMSVQSLLKGKLPQAAMPKVLEIIEREDRRLARFVDELLDLGRIRSGHLHFTFEEVDLSDVVRQAAGRLNGELARSGSSLSITSEGQPVGQWDKFRLDQVVANLLSNAIKFGLGKPIEISVRANGGRATLVVRDQGVGIPSEMHERIFQPFERAVSARHYGGLGLGLHIVRTIVEGLGGTVRLESRPDHGSTFTVELPRVRPS